MDIRAIWVSALSPLLLPLSLRSLAAAHAWSSRAMAAELAYMAIRVELYLVERKAEGTQDESALLVRGAANRLLWLLAGLHKLCGLRVRCSVARLCGRSGPYDVGNNVVDQRMGVNSGGIRTEALPSQAMQTHALLVGIANAPTPSMQAWLMGHGHDVAPLHTPGHDRA